MSNGTEMLQRVEIPTLSLIWGLCLRMDAARIRCHGQSIRKVGGDGIKCEWIVVLFAVLLLTLVPTICRGATPEGLPCKQEYLHQRIPIHGVRTVMVLDGDGRARRWYRSCSTSAEIRAVVRSVVPTQQQARLAI